MFDIIGGTSTGGILATALGVRKASLLEAEEIYRSMILTSLFYESSHFGTTRDALCPKRKCGS